MRFALTCAAFLTVASPVLAQHYRAIDGDTIAIGPEDLRIVGLDTPETKFAACSAERSPGPAAHRRLQELLNAGPVSITRQRVTRGPNKGKPKLPALQDPTMSVAPAARKLGPRQFAITFRSSSV